MKTDQNETPNLNWEIVPSVPAYSNITKRYILCLYENFELPPTQTKKSFQTKDLNLFESADTRTSFW